jgi:hypothetical protein
MEYLNKLNRGLELLEKAANNSELLGLALISIHGALEDYCRFCIASNSKADEQERLRVQNVREVQWKELLDLMKKYENLQKEERNLIFKMNRERQKVGHGEPFLGTRSDLEYYARFVENMLYAKSESVYSMKSSVSKPYLREDIRREVKEETQNLREDDVKFEEDKISINSPITENLQDTTKKPFFLAKSDRNKFLFDWLINYFEGIRLAIISILVCIAITGPLIGLIYYLKIIGLKEYVILTSYLLIIILFISFGSAQEKFFKQFPIEGLKWWIYTSLASGFVVSHIIINYFPSLVYPITFFNLKTLARIANNPLDTSNLWLIPSVSTGLIMGGLQWLILKQESKRAFWWILANMVELPLLWLGMITLFTAIQSKYTLIPIIEQTDVITLSLLLCLGWPMLCRCITGIALTYIFSDPQERLEKEEDTYFSQANLGDDNFRETDLKETDLRETDLKETNLKETNLKETDLKETDLRKPDLRKPDLRKPDLRNDDLRETDPWGTDPWETDLKETDLRKPDLRNDNLRETDPWKTDPWETDPWETDLKGTDLKGTNLSGDRPQRGRPQRGRPQRGRPQRGRPQRGRPQRGRPQGG